MLSVEHLMEIEEKLRNGYSRDAIFNDIYEAGKADAIADVKKACAEHHADKSKRFIEGCQTCKQWKNHRGCAYYNRPCDWEV